MNDNYLLGNTGDQRSYDLSLFETLLTYIRHWRWFLLSIIICLALAYAYIRIATPAYKIETDLLIKDNKSSTAGGQDLLKDLNLFSSDKLVDNEIQILKSSTILRRTIEDLKLQTTYFNTEGVRRHQVYGDVPIEVELLKPNLETVKAFGLMYTISLINTQTALLNGKQVPLNQPVPTESGDVVIKHIQVPGKNFGRNVIVKFNNIEQLVADYSYNLKIEPASKQSMVLIITLEDALPARGKSFLNHLVQEYNQAALDDKNRVTANTLAFIKDRLLVIAGELGTDEKNVEQYKTSNSITDIGAQSQLFLESVKDNDAELSKVQIQLKVLNNLENYLNSNQDKSQTIPSTLGIDDPSLVSLVTKIAELQLRRESLLQTVPETNPIIGSLNDQIASLKVSLNSAVENLKSTLQITGQHLQSKNNNFEGTIKKVPGKERGLLDVMRQQEIKNGLFTYLLQKREETAMQLASGVADSRIIDYAKNSIEPVKPVRGEIYLFSLLVAFVVPIAVIYIRKLLNYKVSRRQDIESVTQTPILAEISHSYDEGALVVSIHPRSMVSEQIRVLRTNLQFIAPKPEEKVILFTSSISGEGKSFVSLNLGGSLSIAGKKTVILELDLRKPKLHIGLGIDNEVGLSNFLIGKAGYDDIIKSIPIQENYSIITCGPIPPNPAELLTNGRIKVLINYLKEHFDYIILDAPPVGLVTDAQILAEFADVTMFIVRHNYTAKDTIKSIDDFYQSKKFNNLNIVLNAIDLQMGYGTSYYYGYGYGYGGGYYTQQTNKKGKWATFLFGNNRNKRKKIY
jgi:tyrosine-protein kinase Etk/Wzc